MRDAMAQNLGKRLPELLIRTEADLAAEQQRVLAEAAPAQGMPELPGARCWSIVRRNPCTQPRLRVLCRLQARNQPAGTQSSRTLFGWACRLDSNSCQQLQVGMCRQQPGQMVRLVSLHRDPCRLIRQARWSNTCPW